MPRPAEPCRFYAFARARRYRVASPARDVEGAVPYDRRERLYTMVRLYRIGARGRLIAAPTEHGFVTSVGAGVPDRPQTSPHGNCGYHGKMFVPTVGVDGPGQLLLPFQGNSPSPQIDPPSNIHC